MGAFELLSKDILDVLSTLGIEEETKPQEEAIPPILNGENTLVIAPTGVGKTEAAVLPILDKILDDEERGFKVLYITPLKALNRDMVQRIRDFSDRLDFRVGVRHGDTSRKERRRQSNDPPEFLITTPETLQIMFTGSKLRKGLKNVRYVVIDELNELAIDERGSQLSIALERLVELSGYDFQRIGLSATVGSPERVLRFLVGQGREGVIIEASGQREIETRIEKPRKKNEDEKLAEVMRCDIDRATVIRRTKELIDEHRSTLFFVNTRDAAESLSSCFNLWDEDYPIGVHHGSLSKEARIEVENAFKKGILRALICTSSMELGIDLGKTDFVLQYQSPRQVTRYIQRVGRSGHKIGEVSKGCVITTSMDDIGEAAVIGRRTLTRELEETDIPLMPLSVLANQLISTVNSERKVDKEKFYQMVKRAYPFRRLDRKTYEGILQQLSDIRVIWEEENEIGKRRASLSYFYENISMIPDEKTFLLKNMASSSIIGTLDESFVAAQVEIGGVITLQGKTWRIIDIDDDEIVANPVGDLGKIPDWAGEDIPVPFEVAQEVGWLRERGWGDENYDYPVDDHTKSVFDDYIEEQGDHELASDSRVVIEFGKKLVVINACFGTQVNNTLGRLIVSLLTARLGESIALHIDPYRIMMKLPRRVMPSDIEDILKKTDPETVLELLKKAMRNSSFFRWKFLHVAKKFGAVKKDIDYRSVSLDRLMDAFEGTPLLSEAIDKTVRDNMDVGRTKDVLSDIQDGKIGLVISKKGISPMGKAGLEQYKELLSPQQVSHAILQSLKERLESEKIIMKCLKCGTRRRKRVRDVDKPSCPICGSAMVAPLMLYQDENIVDKDKEKLDEEERKKMREYYKLADLARVYKHKAVMALAARGVGHEKAGRILGRDYRDEDEFLRAILEAEIQYARTKKFWD